MLLDDFARRDLPPLLLSPLATGEIEALAAHIWPRLAAGYRGHIAAMLAQATGGNALFVTAVLQELATSETLPSELPVPTTVQDLLQRRLRRSPQSSRQVLETLAVLGGSATLTQLQQISARSDEEVAQALEWGLQWGLVAVDESVSPTSYKFHHDLVRQAVYASLSTIRKQRLHGRVATWLARIAKRHATPSQQEMAGRILYHAQLGEAFDLLFQWAPAAADHARQLFAYPDAMHTLDMMRYAYDQLRFSPDFDLETAEPILFDQLVWWLDHNWVLGKSDEEEQAVFAQAQALLARYPSPMRAAQLQRIYAHTSLNFEEAIPLMLDVHDQLMALGELSQAAWALGIGAGYSITLSRNKDGRRLFEQALALLRQAGDVAGEVQCLSGLSWTAINLGEIAVALDHAQQALTISQAQGDRLGEAQALYSLAASWTFYHAPDKMEAAAKAAKSLYEQMGYYGRTVRPYLTIGAVHDVRGDWQTALSIYQDVLAQATGFGDYWTMGWAAQLLGRIYLSQGQLDATEEKLQQARQIRANSGERQNQVSDLTWLGRLALAQGNTGAALTHTAQAVAQLDAFQGEFYVWEQPDVLLCRAEALEAAGQTAEALAVAQQAQTMLHRFAQQIEDEAILAQFLAYPLNVRVETAVATQQIPLWPAL